MINERKSKIVAKIADNRSDVPFLKSLFAAGADVAWLNTAHQDEEATIGVIERIRSVTTSIPIMIDTKGPEVRTKDVAKALEVKAGDSVILSGDATLTGDNVIHVSYGNFHNEVPVGESVLYDDASMELTVKEKVDRGIRCEVKNGGTIKNKKSINVPNVHIKLPALSEKDKGFIRFCAVHNVDYIAHSFVRSKEDLFEIKNILKEYPEYKGKIISKIENREGFNNIAEILEHSEGLMVARGDLGAEVPLEEMTFMQKKLVTAALEKGSYCIVATQVLESMIKNPRPTRAEVTDAFNAILDGSGAISMSGETAYGDYPMEATNMMGRIMRYAELKRSELVHFTASVQVKSQAYTDAKAIVTQADAASAKAIVVQSTKIDVVRALAALRPSQLIIPLCHSENDVRELMMAYAVRPILVAQDGSNALKQIEGPFAEADMFAYVSEDASGMLHTKIQALKEVRENLFVQGMPVKTA